MVKHQYLYLNLYLKVRFSFDEVLEGKDPSNSDKKEGTLKGMGLMKTSEERIHLLMGSVNLEILLF